MDFLFRTPLLAFDPKDHEAIRQNWKFIQKAIENSSPDFAQSIRGKEFGDLSIHQRKKLLKYLIRGRYRATPFGYWSGVGLGTWSSSYSNLDLSTRLIQNESGPFQHSEDEEHLTFQIAPGIRREMFHYVYWSYGETKEGWLANFILRSRIPDLVYDWFQDNSTLTLEHFSTWFSKLDSPRIHVIWERLKRAGLLRPSPGLGDFPKRSDASVDLKVSQPLTLPFGIRDQLEKIPKEMASLFVAYSTPYLEGFKDWFTHEYDDRFVRMDRILPSRRFWPSRISKENRPEPIPELNGSLWEIGQELDLSKTFPKTAVQDLSQLQVLFRISSGDQLIIENFTCNNPFALMGRFGNDQKIAEYFKKILSTETSEDPIFADIQIQESKKSQLICSHPNLFRYTIDCTGTQDGPNYLKLSDLRLGISEGKFRIFSESLGKTILPVVQHPLNPAFISHPLSRMLWEIAQQDSFRFLPHTSTILSLGKFCPKITWSGICLQRPQWTIAVEDLKQYGSVKQLQKRWQLPNVVTFGNHDRELVLDLNDPMDCAIIEQELRSKGRCHVSTAEWIGQSPIKTVQGQHVYPQFLKSWNLQRPMRAADSPINFLTSEDPDWLYVKIYLSEEFLMPFLEKGLGSLVQRVLGKTRCSCWYFLYYRTKEQEIRLRFKAISAEGLAEIKAEIFHELEANGMVLNYRFEPYFPERSKFGMGMEVSEKLFEIESQFFIDSPRRNDLEKAHILAFLFFRIFWEHISLDWLMVMVREGQKLCKRSLKPKFKHHFTDFFPEKLLPIVENYICVMKSHPEYERVSDATFLLHHLHLFVNRMFQNRSQEYEPYVHYAIYRQLKRAEAGIVPFFD